MLTNHGGVDNRDPRDRFFRVDHLQENLARHTGRSAKVVLLFAIAKLLLSLATTAVLARLILPEEHGVLAQALPAVLIAAGLSEFGLAQALVQREKVSHRLASALFWVNALLGAILASAVFLLGVWAAEFYGTEKVIVVFQVLSPYVFVSVLTTQYMALLRRQMQVGKIERCVMLATVCAALVAIVMATLGFGVEALIAQLLLVQVMTLVLLVFTTGWLPSGPWVLLYQPIRDILSYGGFLAIERMLNEFATNMQLAIVGRFFGTLDAGLYFRADAIAQMPQRRVLSPLSAAFIPALSRLQDNPDGLRQMLVRQIMRANLIVIPIGAAMAGSSDVAVMLLLGPYWTDAAPIVAAFGFWVSASATQSCMTWTLVAVGQSRPLFQFRMLNTIIILGSVLLAIGSGVGMLGATAVFVLTTSGIGLLHLAIWLIGFSPIRWKDVAPCLIDTFGMTLLMVGGAIGLRMSLSVSPWVESGFVFGFVVFVLALRCGLQEDTRADIIKLFRRN